MSDIAGKGCEILVPFSERKPLPEIERSLIKKYRKNIWTRFIKAVKEFELIKEGDRVAAGVSGGKDSMLMAKLLQELQKHGDVSFELEFIAMDPGYHENIRELLIENCKYLEIPIHLFESGICLVVDKFATDYPCYRCAKMRRGALYGQGLEL
ncbi:MAG: tRNA 2-thiocytidine biosynthesis protein TtcA, partial [Clostridiaceae bacterium]|nr:tRNA 2-thiocytidine biosynthesis protein TtcA [Clostridiaceae bacterium]